VIKYTKGFKYQLREQAVFKTNITPAVNIYADLVTLYTSGLLVIEKYFAWDGCSGPTYDDKTNMRAGLCHDALYYLMRSGKLDIKWRGQADLMLEKLMLEDGALKCRASYYRWAVDKFAKSCAMTKNSRKVLTAP